ncbi:hypothetical protein BBW65_04215 [Helicobacter enhydrae]|uniref:Outer membrane protein beta-barrel domain-containing protein n=1 Tax=Helicobacter enhydrae TaxID=222136 RepID=A0A1B1U5I1_9HELI|nr:hypothetical protein [Helicobacter enhydrae]ANV98054.1 hypothetical protein BBW65_04215 [Helicobacter enhydrae]
MLETLALQKKKIESKSDREIQSYIDSFSKEKQEKIRAENKIFGITLGSLGLTSDTMFNLGKTAVRSTLLVTAGPKYNITRQEWSPAFQDGFYIGMPVGIGVMFKGASSAFDTSFVMPIGLEASYKLGGGGFGFTIGTKYEFALEELGTLHIADVYAGIHLSTFFFSVGYIFFSKQNITLFNRSFETDPLSGGFSFQFAVRM